MNTKHYLLSCAGALVLALLLSSGQVCAADVNRKVELHVDAAHPVMLADTPGKTYVRIRLRGFEIEPADRAPVNVAIVLDKSGSMEGQKIEKAREAALAVVDRLNDRDIMSLVSYDSTVSVLIPATKVSDRAGIRARIQSLMAGGSTALFAGVSKGAAEVQKFLEPDRVNRIVLLSDGLANVGPSAPEDLGELGASLFKSGISVTTIGLGLDYNEDLLALLARRSNGSHLFAQEAADLTAKFDLEFGDVLSTVAQDTVVRFKCSEGTGVRPVRVLGREGTVDGAQVTVNMGQLFSSQDKYVIIELEAPALKAGNYLNLGEGSVEYRNLISGETVTESHVVPITFSASQEEVDHATDAKVMVSVVRQIGAERNAAARVLRDSGDIDGARAELQSNTKWFVDNATRFDSGVLRQDAASNSADAQNLDDENWREQRKEMLENQMYQQLQSLGYVE